MVFKDLYDKSPMSVQNIMKIHSTVYYKVVGITFADGKHCVSERVRKEASDSKYFDEFIAYGPSDIDDPGICDPHGFYCFKPTWF